jgi:predicted dehydrogenase
MPLKLAIVGFGRLAQGYYAPALKILEPDARYLIVDPALESRDRAQKIFPEAKCFREVDEISETLIDAALIASPPSTHFLAWRTLATRNIPIFMEKPFPLPHELPLLDSLRGNGASLIINFNRRFWPPYRRLLDFVTAGAIGVARAASLQLIVDCMRWNSVTNHRVMEPEGGVLHDLGGHVVEFASRLFGSLPAEVSATRNVGLDGDRVSLTLLWPDGRLADCTVGYGRPACETILVVGSTGRLSMTNPHGRIWPGERSSASWAARMVDLMSVLTYALCPSRSLIRFTIRAALRAFLNGVRTGTLSGPSLDDAIRVAKVLAAGQESIVSGGKAMAALP